MAGSLIPQGAPDIPGAPDRIPGTPARVPSQGELRAPASVHLRDMNGRYVNNGFGWEWHNLQEFMNFPQRFGEQLLDDLDEAFKDLADEIEIYAKENAPWQDQTGDARRGLKSLYIRKGDIFEVDLGHSVDYGYFLEHHNGGEYAIVQPTLRHFAPDMMNLGKYANKKAGGPALPGRFE